MKKVGKEPMLLPSVMEAIARLKEKQGSTQKHIVEHVGHILKRNNDGNRNVAVQVRRALVHGLKSGLIKQRGGKFRLGLDREDYAILRRFGILNDLPEDCAACRGARRSKRRKSKGRRGRRERKDRRGRRKYRKHISEPEDNNSDSCDFDRTIIAGSLEPMEKGRRRRHRRGRKSRRGRRSKVGRSRRRHSVSDKRSNHSSETGGKDSNTAALPEKKRSDESVICYPSKSDSNHIYHEERQQGRNQEEQHDQEEDIVECGDMECVCGNRQEDDCPRCLPRENKYFKGSYLN